MDNTLTFSGNITRDPELRYTTGGRGVASFGLAVNRSWKDKNDEWQEEVTFVDVTAWGDLGENVAASLTKGARVIVTGRLNQRSYENREGEKRTVYEVIADDIGASMKRATVEVAKTERSSASQKPASAPLPDEEPF